MTLHFCLLWYLLIINYICVCCLLGGPEKSMPTFPVLKSTISSASPGRGLEFKASSLRSKGPELDPLGLWWWKLLIIALKQAQIQEKIEPSLNIPVSRFPDFIKCFPIFYNFSRFFTNKILVNFSRFASANVAVVWIRAYLQS